MTTSKGCDERVRELINEYGIHVVLGSICRYAKKHKMIILDAKLRHLRQWLKLNGY